MPTNPDTTAARRRTSRRTRLAAGAAAVLALATGSVVVTTATPAQAASAVSFCFQRSQTDSPLAHRRVLLYSVSSTGQPWTYLRTGYTDHRGCGTFFSTPQAVRLRPFVSSGGYLYGTPYYAPTGGAGYFLGTGKAPS